MKFLSYGKDGGPDSTVSGFWLVEIKSLFSIVLLKFEDGSRDAYHNHAFHAVSWLLSGCLTERVVKDGVASEGEDYYPSFRPIFTSRSRAHKVFSSGDSWVLSFRGPWTKTWNEWVPKGKVTLTNGRKEV